MLAFLGLTLVVLIATLVLARWSFEHGFRDYVNALEQTRLDQASLDIASLYIENNMQWKGINQRRLSDIINYVPDYEESDSSVPKEPPPFERLPPPGLNTQNDFEPPERPDRPPRGGPYGKPSGKPSPPTAVFDSNGEVIAGPVFRGPAEEVMAVPIKVDGELVGTVKSEPRRRFSSPIETAFARQQFWTSGFIGLASLLFAAAVSWWLTQLLLAPVRLMIRGVNRLSKGDYTQPLTVENRHDEFGQLIGDINHLTHTLEQNQTSRRRWIADISHELRTPLAILTGEIEALKDGIRPFSREQLLSLDQEIQRLSHLTDDLYQLSVSDIGGLRYEFATIDLRDSVNDAVSGCRLIAAEKDIVISFQAGSAQMISGDVTRINQLLVNLIRNSVAYTDAPGKILLTLWDDGESALLTVCDTPPGCPGSECAQLFEPLYRQDASRNSRSAGAGLGLAICRNIVDAHRGTITASPSSLGGLKITISLPLAESKV